MTKFSLSSEFRTTFQLKGTLNFVDILVSLYHSVGYGKESPHLSKTSSIHMVFRWNTDL